MFIIILLHGLSLNSEASFLIRICYLLLLAVYYLSAILSKLKASVLILNRSYKNGYVWHDLTEEDFIHPVHGNEYVLKGTELLNLGPVSCSENSVGTASSTSSTGKILETSKSNQGDFNFSAPLMRSQKKNWGSLELKEYNVYRAKLMEPDNKTGNNFSNVHQSMDASTQTEEKRYRRREITYPPANLTVENKTIELMRDEYSPPPTSSPETLETLVRRYNGQILGDQYLMAGNVRGKTSAVLMHLISCGSIAVKGQRVAVVPQHGARLTKGSHSPIGGSCRLSGGAKVVVEKEYFSGSLLETKEDEQIAAVLKRCSSYNAERYIVHSLVQLLVYYVLNFLSVLLLFITRLESEITVQPYVGY